MPPLIINGQPQSAYVRTTRMACIEAGVDHELKILAEGSIDAVIAALRTDAYRKKHPFSKMPTLEDGKYVVFETTAICRYVSEKYGNGCLVPSDLQEAVRMEQWVSAANCYIIPDTVQRFVAPLIFETEPDYEAIEKDKPILRAHYERLDTALVGRTTLAGDTVTVADLLYAPLLHVVGLLPDGPALFEGLPNLERWWTNISTRPSFTDTYVPMPDPSELAA